MQTSVIHRGVVAFEKPWPDCVAARRLRGIAVYCGIAYFQDHWQNMLGEQCWMLLRCCVQVLRAKIIVIKKVSPPHPLPIRLLSLQYGQPTSQPVSHYLSNPVGP